MKHILCTLLLLPQIAIAGPPVVLDVKAEQQTSVWTFHVTLEHGDTGWDHYADGWGIYTLDGTEIGYRVLAHPHENEQPFTRSLSGVTIPTDVTRVLIKPRDSVHGIGADYVFDLPLN